MGVPPTLIDLPVEILILLIELGPLEVSDALSLRQTCRLLYEWSYNHSFWSAVIRSSMCAGRPPALPSFRPLRDISVNGPKDICIRQQASAANLAKQEPSPKVHRIVVLPSSLDWVSHVVFLPGGDAFIILYEDGSLKIWVIKGDAQRLSFATEVMQDAVGLNDPCRLETRISDPKIDFDTEGDAGSTIRPIILGSNEEGTATRVIMLQFQISWETITASFQAYGPCVVPSGSLAQYTSWNGIFGGIWSDADTSTVFVALVDFVKINSMIIDTGIATQIETGWDVRILWGGDLCIFGHNSAIMTTYVYFNVESLLSTDPDSTLQYIPVARIPPNSQRLFKLKFESPFPDHVEHTTMHPYNVPNARTGGRIPTFIEGISLDLLAGNGGLEWIQFLPMEIRQILDLVKRPGEMDDVCLSRSWYPLSTMEDIEMIVLGTLGNTIVWVEEVVWMDEKRGMVNGAILRLFQVAYSDCNKVDRGASKILKLPLDMGMIPSQLAFCDEAAVLAVATGHPEIAQEIHLFEY